MRCLVKTLAVCVVIASVAVLTLPVLAEPSASTLKARSATIDEEASLDAAPAETTSVEQPGETAQKTQPADKATADLQPKEQKAEPPAKPTLSQEMTELRDNVRRTLSVYLKQTLNTRECTPADVLDVCLAFGCDAEVERGSSNDRANAFTCLCWGHPCAGYQLLKICDKHIAARLGYGYQRSPSQFLAVLALARVPADYPLRVGQDVRSVKDLVESEKLSCRAGTDLSFKLIGLARYLPDDTPWKNDLGESWSKERLIKEELDRSAGDASNGGLDRLMALSYAIDRREAQGKPLDGEYRRAQKYVEQFQDYALKLQNTDGSWHPRFFAARGSGGSAAEQLRSTGYILEWLTFSLPDERLQGESVVASVARVTALLNNQRQHRSPGYWSGQQVGGRMHALHALALYDQRVFQPFDEPAPAAEPEKPSAAGSAPQASAEDESIGDQAKLTRLPTTR